MKPSKYLILLTLLLVAVVPALGQDVDLPETFTFETGTTFNYPADSQAVQDETAPEFASIELGDNQFLNLLDYAFFEAEGLEASDDLTDALAWYIDYLFSGTVALDADEVEALDDEIGREALRLSYVDDAGNMALLIAVRFDDGTFGLIDAFTEDADFKAEEVALAVATSFNNDTTETGAAPAAVVDDATPCMVSTDRAGVVQLRVGPGTNRTVYAFLPAGHEFTPLGKAAASDDSEWFQLDKDEVAPNAAAAEAWVAVDDVDSSGNCETIGEAAAPPVIPIVPAAPPADSSSSGDNGEAAPVPAGGQVPQSGAWTVSTNDYVDASCAGGPNVRGNVPAQSFAVSISVRGGGASFTTSGDNFVKTGPGQYTGSTTFPDGTNAQVYLTVNSPTLMTGSGVLNFTLEGEMCSGTIGLRMTRN